MHAVWIARHGSPDVLEVREGEPPEPGPGQLRIRVRACGLNFADVLARQGLHPDTPDPPCVVGYEGAGVVDRLGPDVWAPPEGTRVVFLSPLGAQASQVCVPAALAVPIPDDLRFTAAAVLAVDYVTAYHMLFEVAHLGPNKHVLIHLAASGLGTATLQLCAVAHGAVTYGTAPSAEHARLKAQGCDHPIDSAADYVGEVLRLTDGRGVDLIIDPLGGADWQKAYSLLRPTGMLIACGMANAHTETGRWRVLHELSQLARIPRFNPLRLMGDNRIVAGVNIGGLFGEHELLQRELRAVVGLASSGAIRPQVGRCYPFLAAAAAHQDLEAGRLDGKLVLTPE